MSRPSRKRPSESSPEDDTPLPDPLPLLDDDSLQRSGKWSGEEETFANQLVIDFETGALTDCEDGCTLRSYLARKLNCAPMRISKKFAGRCIGKLAFIRRDGALMSTSERIAIESSVIPVLGRPRNINRRPRKNQLRIEPTLNSNDYDQMGMYSGASSPLRDELNEESSNSSSDETDTYFDSALLKMQMCKSECETRQLLGAHTLSVYPNLRIAQDMSMLPSLTIDDFCYYGDFEVAYDSLFQSADKTIPYHVDGDDWRDVLSFFCDDDEGA